MRTSTYVLAGAVMFLAFLSAVALRPDLHTVMAAGTAAVVFLKIAYDYLEDDEPDVDAMFE